MAREADGDENGQTSLREVGAHDTESPKSTKEAGPEDGVEEDRPDR